MKATLDLNTAHPDQTDLRLFCGSRFNAFTRERRDEAGKFFERGAWKSINKSRGEDDGDRWDAME